MSSASNQLCFGVSKTKIKIEDKMPRPKISRLKGMLPSIVLFGLVLAYLTGYIAFRSNLFYPSPKAVDFEGLQGSRLSAARFYEDWVEENNARNDWRAQLSSCVSATTWRPTEEWWKKPNRTDPNKSFISLWQIRPTGEYSRFFIQSQDIRGEPKLVGGDSWRIRICGPSCINPIIRDFGNGSYQVKFLTLEPGKYRVNIHLDYTLCDGIKDPPVDWFIKGNSQGKDQEHGILGRDIPYMKKPFWNNEPLHFTVLKSKFSDEELELRIQTACQSQQISKCKLLWNGLGRWVNFTWKPFCTDTPYPRWPHEHKGFFWIFGDSTATRLHWSIHGKSFCHSIFKRCLYSYNWIYEIDNFNLTQNKFIRRNQNRTFLKRDDDRDFDANRIIRELQQVLYNPQMDEHSVLLLNYGLHFAEALNFSNFRILIDSIGGLLKNQSAYKPSVIWRTTTSLNRHKYSVPYLHSRRFLTPQRVGLFNAYANDVMCKSGIPILDVYPLTNSYPNGTGNSISPFDPVHYEHHVLFAVEDLLAELFG